MELIFIASSTCAGEEFCVHYSETAANCQSGLDFSPSVRQNVYMRVISIKPLREFWKIHKDAKGPLRQWYKVVKRADWARLSDVRKIYPHADTVRTEGGGTLTVFNIGGNKYRLIARIRYDYRLVNVRIVLTHKDYDNRTWKE